MNPSLCDGPVRHTSRVPNSPLRTFLFWLITSSLFHTPELYGQSSPSEVQQAIQRLSVASAHIDQALLDTKATGLPATQRFQFGAVTGYGFKQKSFSGRIFLDDHTHLGLPQFGAVSFDVDCALTLRENRLHGTTGVYLNVFGFLQGVEWNFRENKALVRLAVDVVLRRGGLNSWADRFRLEYVPAYREIQIGFSVSPYWQHRRRNRPRDREAVLPSPQTNASLQSEPRPDLVPVLNRIVHAMQWLDNYLTPRLVFGAIDSNRERKRFDRAVQPIGDHSNLSGHTFREEDSAFHASLLEAFTLASGNDLACGNALYDVARNALLQDVIIPTNRLFCQRKKPLEIDGYCTIALKRFKDRMQNDFARLDDTYRNAAEIVFSRVLESVKQVFRNGKDRWEDPRLIWLPLNYGLTRDQYDSQMELDDVLGMVVGQRLTNANTVSYLLNDTWYYELERMIQQTANYHVLIIHDVAGLYAEEPDQVSWRLVTEGYIKSLIDAIHAIDAGDRDRLPDFTIFIDEHYFQVNKTRLLMHLLQNLYDPGRVRLGDTQLQHSVDSSLSALRQVIANSPTFRAKSKRDLQRLFRVHVNVTNVFEPIYSEDALMRDHRKIAFRDIFESDPASGEAIVTGEGVGQSYVSPDWEDRSLKLQGADLFHLKSATRELFLSQGYGEQDVPYFLRSQDFSPGHAQRCDSLRAAGWTASVAILMNVTGYGPKFASTAKAVLYNLMPPGSIIIAPDPLWASDFWTGMFVSCALRGATVLPICPGRLHAPSDAVFTLEAVRENLTCMLEASDKLKSQIDAAGGALRIGLYLRNSDVKNVPASLRAVIQGIQGDSMLARAAANHSQAFDTLVACYERISATSNATQYLLSTKGAANAKLHLKVQFFANHSALAALTSEQLSRALKQYVESAERQMVDGSTTPGIEMSGVIESLASQLTNGVDSNSIVADSLSKTTGGLPCNSIIYLTAGSHNQDRRSMMLDGEDLAVVGGSAALVGGIDLAFLVSSAHWITSRKELDDEFHQQRSLVKSIVHWLKDVI